MLNQLFQDSDHILFMLSDQNKVPHSGMLVKASRATPDLGVYYAINPIDPLNNRNEKGAATHRASINVTAFRNFLFEIDSLPLDTQESLIRHLATFVPPAQVTFSGSSSLHMILSVADTLPFEPHTAAGIAQYSQAWRALNAELTEISSAFLGNECPGRLFDPSCKDPSRLSRVPGALRPDTLKIQTELDIPTGFISSDDVLTLMNKHKFADAQTSAPKLAQVSEMDMNQFSMRLLYPENRGLRSKLLSAADWASTEYMYPAVFQLTLWIIDSIGAPPETALNYLRENVFPAIHSAGYPRNPEIAVYNAYIWKGLL